MYMLIMLRIFIFAAAHVVETKAAPHLSGSACDAQKLDLC